MKKTLLSLSLLGSIASFAQTNTAPPFLKRSNSRHNSLANYILNGGNSGPIAQKPTGTKQRVIAQVGTDENAATQDSTVYKYSGTRGSSYNYNSLELIYNEDFQSDYLPVEFMPYGNKSSELQADSILSFMPQNPSMTISRAYYNASNKVDSTKGMDDNGITTLYKKYHTFNSSGYLTKVTELQSGNGGATYDTTSLTKYYYNTAGTQLQADTILSFDGTAMTLFSAGAYRYNTQQALDTVIRWVLNGTVPGTGLIEINAIDYNAAGKLRKLSSYSYNGDQTPYASYIDTFGYTGSLPFYTLNISTYNDLEQGTTDVEKVEKFAGANNLPDSLSASLGDGTLFMPYAYAKYHYNSFNNPDTLSLKMLDGTQLGAYVFHYETYDDGNSTSVKGVSNRKSLNVYPNPFDNNVNIDWKGATTGISTVTVVNMLGQNIYTATLRLSQGHNVIDLPSLPKGQYILSIRDANGDHYSRPLTRK